MGEYWRIRETGDQIRASTREYNKQGIESGQVSENPKHKGSYLNEYWRIWDMGNRIWASTKEYETLGKREALNP